MIGGVTRLGGLPGLPGRVTLSAGVAFCHVNGSRWGNPPSWGRVHVTVNCLWRRLFIIKSDNKKPQHWNVAARADNERKRTLTAKMRRDSPFSLFTCLATTQQGLVTSPRDPGVVSLHVNASHFSTTARRVTSPTWGPPPPGKQALKECNIATLHQRRQWLTERLFNGIKDNSLHKLHGLLPPRNLSIVVLRRKHAFNVPFCKTKRLMNSFIMHNAAIS